MANVAPTLAPSVLSTASSANACTGTPSEVKSPLMPASAPSAEAMLLVGEYRPKVLPAASTSRDAALLGSSVTT
jgi:hypothetical protein